MFHTEHFQHMIETWIFVSINQRKFFHMLVVPSATQPTFIQTPWIFKCAFIQPRKWNLSSENEVKWIWILKGRWQASQPLFGHYSSFYKIILVYRSLKQWRRLDPTSSLLSYAVRRGCTDPVFYVFLFFAWFRELMVWRNNSRYRSSWRRSQDRWSFVFQL